MITVEISKYVPATHRPPRHTIPEQHRQLPWAGTVPTVRRTMEKLEYAKWIEGVKSIWKVGDFATITAAPVLQNKAPLVLFVVDHIQEVHFLAELDYNGIPKAIGIKQPGEQAVQPCMYPPTALRKLTEEEQAIVRLGNKSEPEGSATTDGSGPAPAVESGKTTVSSSKDGRLIHIDFQTGELLS